MGSSRLKRRAPGAKAPQLLPQRLDGAVHPAFQVVEIGIGHRGSLSQK